MTSWAALCDRYQVAVDAPDFRQLYWRTYPGWRDREDRHDRPSSLEAYALWLAADPNNERSGGIAVREKTP